MHVLSYTWLGKLRHGRTNIIVEERLNYNPQLKIVIISTALMLRILITIVFKK